MADKQLKEVDLPGNCLPGPTVHGSIIPGAGPFGGGGFSKEESVSLLPGEIKFKRGIGRMWLFLILLAFLSVVGEYILLRLGQQK